MVRSAGSSGWYLVRVTPMLPASPSGERPGGEGQSQGSHQSGVPLSSIRGWNHTRW